MRTEREATRIVRSWLEDGVTALPDPVLDAVLDQLPATHQRRAPWWPVRRLPTMNNALKYGLAAAVLVVAALLGFNYFAAPNVGGPGDDDPAPTPSPTPAALRSGPLDPGRYAIDEPRRTPVRFALTVPAGWTARTTDSALFKHENQPDEVGLFSFVVTHVYADACEPGAPLTAVGSTVDDLARALEDQAASEASDPVDLTIGGYAALRIDMSAEAGLEAASCRLPDGLQIWADATESDFFAMAADTAASVYIADVGGERAVFVAGGNTDSSAADLAELDAIIASITFEP